MPDINLKPAVLNITAKHGEKYNLLLNNKVAGVLQNITGTYSFAVRKRGNTVNAVTFTNAPNIVVTGSQILIKMDDVLALPAGDYDIELWHTDAGAERPEVQGLLTIKSSIKPSLV